MKLNKFNTEKGIGDEGVKVLCELLKVNTTIRSLNLSGLVKKGITDKEKGEKHEWMNDRE